MEPVRAFQASRSSLGLRRFIMYPPKYRCSHWKWSGSSEFSWHCSQLQGRTVLFRLAVAFPSEDVPAGQQRHRLGAHVREYQAAELLDLVRLQVNLVLELAALGLGGLVDAVAVHVEHPAVVGAANPFLLRDAVGEVRLAVRAGGFDEAELACGAPEQHEVFAEDAHLARRGVLVQLLAAGDGVPVAPHQIAHRRTGANPGQTVVSCPGSACATSPEEC